MKYTVLVAVLLLTLQSCVTNRKLVYLQHDDVNAPHLPKDTTVREYVYSTSEYRIQPNDILSIRFQSLTPKEFNFFDQESQNTAALFNSMQANPLLIGELVDLDGMVPFPVVGKVRVAGLTVFEAQDTLQDIASQYLQNPIVKVRLINFRVTILGEVNSEGTITLTNNRATIMEAIGLVGGLSDLADKENIKLIRLKEGKAEIQYLNLLDEDLVHSPYFFVEQNDVMIVPALRQRPFRKYFGQNVSLLVSALTLIVLTFNLTQN